MLTQPTFEAFLRHGDMEGQDMEGQSLILNFLVLCKIWVAHQATTFLKKVVQKS